MKLQEYKGKKIVSFESIGEYCVDKKYVNSCKNRFYKWLNNEKGGVLLTAPETKKYGQKNFNYPRGLWIYNLDEVVKALSNHKGYLKDKFDIEAFNHDVGRGMIRELGYKPRALAPKPVIPREMPLPDQTPYEEIYALIDRMNENTIRALTENNEALSQKVDKLTAKIEELLKRDITPKQQIVEEEKVEPIILKENASYEEWHKGIKYAVSLIVKISSNETESSVLSAAYNRIRTQYGIVWEQEAKEFKNEYGRGPRSTRELCWWLETTKPAYKNLLIGKLNTMYSEAKRSLI